ncbi:MAG TPA: glycosyltransferase family 39 protein [Candidatus Parcubacteria bacterium]|nr:hypothetical protein [Parcubacteria group bacterium]HJN62155.1 glycosyltransferase family 39 protein [Candidatus Parcubacteria bacterium]|tara:strand:- start:20707 stop:22410 length:1704 start_codon:yes stop_codon:yes gene_type:complete
MSNRFTLIIAGGLLVIMFSMAVFSIKDDSLTMDELAHLPAGYSYLTQKDMRLNPEHPPLIKDLSAVPLLFLDGINFPSDIKAWKDDVNGQWEFGSYFLYKAGNPTDQMIFWGRIPMILLLILLGVYVFKWARELIGDKGALLALFLFSFSPTFLTHGRLVTTDVGAAAAIFIATYYFIKALKNQSKRNIILAGIALGLAQLLKFSVILLFPFFFFLIIIWWLIKLGSLKNALKTLIFVVIISFLVIGPVYQYHVWNYPPERQLSDAKVSIADYPDIIKEPIFWAAENPFLQGYSQYFTGLFMVFQRAAFGHTTYFMGEISNLGWKSYFPIVYAIKVPLAFHILTLTALLYALWSIRKRKFLEKLRTYFPEFAMISFIGLYWFTSLSSNLNIGVRHLLPTFPFLILLVSKVTINWLKEPFLKIKYILLALLLLWQGASVALVYPHFLSYFNELVGGPDKGYIYTVDSNLDWGQDLKRLAQWVDENNIEEIKIAYFGGADPIYHLGDKAQYFSWEEPQKGWIAVSATFLQVGRGIPIPGLNESSGYFNWLNDYTPVTKIGYSIFIYYIE